MTIAQDEIQPHELTDRRRHLLCPLRRFLQLFIDSAS